MRKRWGDREIEIREIEIETAIERGIEIEIDREIEVEKKRERMNYPRCTLVYFS